MQHELADVVVSALVALATIAPEASADFAERLAFVADRVGVQMGDSKV